MEKNIINNIFQNFEGGNLCQKDFDDMIKVFCDENAEQSQKCKLLFELANTPLTFLETFRLTKAMLESGNQNVFEDDCKTFVDKHSTGGVSDTTTLVVMPIVASLGLCSIKMSGRSLGHTGGTIDKLECFCGFDCNLDKKDALRVCNQTNLALVCQSNDLAPADKYMYALRDKLGLAENKALIASSIMSKKLACGADVLLLDVKCGNGALMQKKCDAASLAKTMVKIGKRFGKTTRAIITDMNQPLGRCIGDEFEVHEALEILSGKIKSGRLYEMCVLLAAHLLVVGKVEKNLSKAKDLAKQQLSSGAALKKLEEVVVAQGGKFDDKLKNFDEGLMLQLKSKEDGFVCGINAKKLGEIYHKMRSEFKTDCGIIICCSIGDKIEAGQPLCKITLNSSDFAPQIYSCFEISKKKAKKPKLVLGVCK